VSTNVKLVSRGDASRVIMEWEHDEMPELPDRILRQIKKAVKGSPERFRILVNGATVLGLMKKVKPKEALR
jgi:hypothetical protein